MSEEKETQKTAKFEYTVEESPPLVDPKWQIIHLKLPEGGVEPFDWEHFEKLEEKGIVKITDMGVQELDPRKNFFGWCAVFTTQAMFPAETHFQLGLHYAAELKLTRKNCSIEVRLSEDKKKLVVVMEDFVSEGQSGREGGL